jgi:hypothetical protein
MKKLDTSAKAETIALTITESGDKKSLTDLNIPALLDPGDAGDDVFTTSGLSETSELCQDCSKSQGISKLRETIESLEQQVAQLQKALEPPPELPPRLCVLHRVFCECNQDSHRTAMFLDPPRRETGDRRWHLEGDSIIPPLSVFLDDNPDIVLVVYKDYKCKFDADLSSRKRIAHSNNPTIETEKQSPAASSESMIIKSNPLLEAMIMITTEGEMSGNEPAHFAIGGEIRSPYHYLYYNRASLRQNLRRADDEHQILVNLLLDYAEKSFQASYDEANILFSQGLVSFETLPYLFEPKMHVVRQISGEIIAYQTKGWIEALKKPKAPEEIGCLRCWSWSFDGCFRKRKYEFLMEWPDSRREVKQIKTLAVYPIKYAEPGVEDELFSRGEKFWDCRNRIYVSYDNQEAFGDTVQVSQFHTECSIFANPCFQARR